MKNIFEYDDYDGGEGYYDEDEPENLNGTFYLFFSIDNIGINSIKNYYDYYKYHNRDLYIVVKGSYTDLKKLERKIKSKIGYKYSFLIDLFLKDEESFHDSIEEDNYEIVNIKNFMIISELIIFKYIENELKKISDNKKYFNLEKNKKEKEKEFNQKLNNKNILTVYNKYKNQGEYEFKILFGNKPSIIKKGDIETIIKELPLSLSKEVINIIINIKENINKMKSQKIKLTELKKLVKQIIKEEQSNKKVIKESKMFFDYILQGSEATEENAMDAARGLDWQEIETKEGNYPNLRYVDTVNGVGIYYNYGTDDYYFTDESINESVKPKTQKIKLSEVRQLVKGMLKENKLNIFYVVFDGTSHIVLDEYDYRDFIKNEPKEYHKILFKSNNEDKAFNKAEELNEQT
jgi:hypothetical protein